MSENNKKPDEFIMREKRFLADLESIDLDRNWKEFSEKLEKRSNLDPHRQKRAWNRSAFLAMAASLLVLISISVVLLNSIANRSVLIQQISSADGNSDLLLEDGTAIQLREGSDIFFPGKFSKKSREVVLHGEAYFNVKSDRSAFLVHTRYTTVEVTGTTFNVRETAKGDVTVNVLSGEVKFSAKTGTSEALTIGPGEEGVYLKDGDSLTRQPFHSENFLFGQTDSLVFTNETLEKVFVSLEENYNVVIKVLDEEILNIKITTSFKDQDVRNIMDEISLLFDISYRVRNDTILVEK